MSENIQVSLWYEVIPDERNIHKLVYDFNFRQIPTELIQPLVHALTYEALSRAGIKYEPTEMEKRFGICIDYTRALEQAVNSGKQLIENNDTLERQKNWKRYQEHCKINDLTTKQIFIDFPL